MKLKTHIAFGLFFGVLFYYFLDFGFELVLITGFAAFLPDFDFTLQNKLGFSGVHRKLCHNIWFMILVSFVVFVLFGSFILSLGIIIGIISHFVADSLTVSGIYWVYPYGKKGKKFHTSGPFSMSDKNHRRRERLIGTVVLTLAGYLFLINEVNIAMISSYGFVGFGIVASLGYVVMNKLDKAIGKVIKSLGL